MTAGGRARGAGRASALVAALVLLVVGAGTPAVARAPGASGPQAAAMHPSAAPPGAVQDAAPGPARVAPEPAPPGPEPPVDPPPVEAPSSGAVPPSAPPTPPPTPARPPGAGVPAPGAGYAWPLVPAPAVVTAFRSPADPYAPGHRGVDLAGLPGQAVVAARGGAVVFAGPVAGRGVVSVQHDDGLRTTYEPVRPTVAAGALVQAGDVIGVLEPGHEGCPAPACLHWGVRRERLEYLDPLVLLRPARVRLLPVLDP